MMRFAMLALIAAVAAGSAGCGEREQSALYSDGKYRGKPDGRPWDSAPPADSRAEWAKGEEAGWHRQMRSRAEGQNENARIGH
jgi:hypothetical protein